MPATDWILISVLAVSLVIGAWRGLVYEVLSVLGWVASFYAAQWLAPQVAVMLPIQSASESIRYAAAFLVVFIAAIFTCGLIAFLLKKIVQSIGLRPIDRMLGAAFGLFRGLILLLVATVVINMTALRSSEWWRESQGAPALTAILKGLKPALPERFGQYIGQARSPGDFF
jgi:membrane protein required for colicin V production